MKNVSHSFNRAAASYAKMALVQHCIAEHLVEKVVATGLQPATILDVGCGTGFVTQLAAQYWPQAELVALDAAPNMLLQTKAQIPQAQTMLGDAARINFAPQFDLVLSSMMAHWLPNPAAVLKKWQGWLNPGGMLAVALLVDGSFQEWRQACAVQQVDDALWAFPAAAEFSAYPSCLRESLPVPHSSALEFLQGLKKIGAATANPHRAPLSAGRLRKILKATPQPFVATYDVLFLVN